jgi:hypothetical protein
MEIQMLATIVIFALSALVYIWPKQQGKSHADAAKVFGQEVLCLPNTGYTVVPARQ